MYASDSPRQDLLGKLFGLVGKFSWANRDGFYKNYVYFCMFFACILQIRQFYGGALVLGVDGFDREFFALLGK